jgi:tetratricopeptide (TPR) repeat protein
MMAMFLKAFDTLIMEHPSDGEAPTLTLKSDARQIATQRAAAAEGSIETEGTSATVIEEKTKKKGIPGWIWWMAIPALLTLWLGMMVISNALELPRPNLISAETLTQEANIKSDPVLGEIQSLNQLIRENPQDPFYRYQLGVAYLEANIPQLARDAFQKAYKLAEGKPEIIIELGDRLTDIDIWTYAAYSYLKADQIGSPLSPEEMKNKISEALYYAAFEEFSLEILTNPEINLDPSLRHLLEARKALLTDRIDVAERLTDQVMQERPDLLEVYLIKSDILFAQKRYDEAKKLLLDLEQIEALPLWIQEALPQPEQ